MILHWKFNHFIVLEKIKETGLGKRSRDRSANLEEREVDEAFTGVALTFEPNESFTPSGSPPSWIKSLFNHASEVKVGLALAMALGLALVVPGALMPILSIVFIDYVLVQGFEDWLPILLGSIVVLALLQFLLNFLQQSITLVFQTRLSIALNSRLINKAMSLSLAFFSLSVRPVKLPADPNWSTICPL